MTLRLRHQRVAGWRLRVWSAGARQLWKRAKAWWAERRRPRTLGELGELAAVRLLRRAGLRIVALRQRHRFGEIDIIAVERRTIVFVEVKTRRSDVPGRPAEAVDAGRRHRLTRAGAAFVKAHQLTSYACRFDVVEVIWPRGAKPKLCHLRGAFQAEGPFHFGR